MTGFEPQTSRGGRDRSTNLATTTAHFCTFGKIFIVVNGQIFNKLSVHTAADLLFKYELVLFRFSRAELLNILSRYERVPIRSQCIILICVKLHRPNIETKKS